MPGDAEVTLAAGFDDCIDILRRHDLFSVALYKPKQGDYWMAQDDTADPLAGKIDHAGDPRSRGTAGYPHLCRDQGRALLAAANGSIDAVTGLTRAVPLALVQDRFGLTHSEPPRCPVGYRNQIDAFWNQPFDALAWPDPAKIVHERETANLAMVGLSRDPVAIREGEVKLGAAGHDSCAAGQALAIER